MAKRLTPKQRALIKAKIKNPDATSDELAAQTGHADGASVRHALASPTVKARVAEMMEKHPKLKREVRLEKLAEGLDATETKFFQKDGEVVETRECVDYQTRHKYLDTAFKLAGDLSQETEAAPASRILIINAINESRKRGISK